MLKQFLCNPQIYLFEKTIKEHIENYGSHKKNTNKKKTKFGEKDWFVYKDYFSTFCGIKGCALIISLV